MANEYEKTITDNWLARSDQATLQKYWLVLSTLQANRLLSDNISLPLHNLKFEGIDRNDLFVIFKVLHRRKFISALVKVNEAPDKSMSVWDDIEDKPQEFMSEYHERSEIQLHPERFDYLLERLQQLNNQNTGSQTIIKPANSTPPEGWELVEDEDQAQIQHNRKEIFTFKDKSTKKYLYFKCLWNNFGSHVDFKTLFEFGNDSEYPGDQKKWKTNDNIRRNINKLKEEFRGSVVNIKISKGATLTIQDS